MTDRDDHEARTIRDARAAFSSGWLNGGRPAPASPLAGYRPDQRGLSTPAGLTVSPDGRVLNWQGDNYERQTPGPTDDEVAAAGNAIADIIARADIEYAAVARAALDAAREARNRPDPRRETLTNELGRHRIIGQQTIGDREDRYVCHCGHVFADVDAEWPQHLAAALTTALDRPTA